VHALRHAHRLLVPGGTLVDLHPVTEEQIEAAGDLIGVIPEPDWFSTHLPNAEARLRDVVRDGLFSPVAETDFDILEHFDEPSDLIEAKREHLEDDELVRRIRAARSPLTTREHMVLRVLRAA
jgi:hypothetical protein